MKVVKEKLLSSPIEKCLNPVKPGVGGWGRRNVPPAIPYADILLLTLNYTSPLNFIQIGSKLPKFLIWGDFRVFGVAGWGGLNMDQTPYVFLFG